MSEQASVGSLRPPLYQRVLGDAFLRLPSMVRCLHSPRGEAVWQGRADVVRGSSRLAGLLCSLMRMPAAGRDQPLTITFSVEGDGERWDRRFAGSRLISYQRGGNGIILERIGPIAMELVPMGSPEGLGCRLRGLRFVGLPLPMFVVPTATTWEYEEEGRYCFDIEASLAGLGLLVRYKGWLEPVSDGATSSSRPSPRRTSAR